MSKRPFYRCKTSFSAHKLNSNSPSEHIISRRHLMTMLSHKYQRRRSSSPSLLPLMKLLIATKCICFFALMLGVVSSYEASRQLRSRAAGGLAPGSSNNISPEAEMQRVLQRGRKPIKESNDSRIVAFQARLKASYRADWEDAQSRAETSAESP